MQTQNQAALDEKNILTDMLTTQKSLMSTYSTMLAETSCPNMRSVLQDLFINAATDQYKVFDIMHQKGYYKTKDASDADVQEQKQSAQDLKTQLN